MDDLYQEEILDLYKNPHNFGQLMEADHTLEEGNQSCGDKFTFYLQISKDQTIKKITFTGIGCAISTASASLLTDYLKGKPLAIIEKLDIPFMQELIGAEVGLARIKCLTL